MNYNHIKKHICLVFICSVVFISCNQETNLEDHLPKESMVVAKVNTKQVLMKFLLGNLSEFSLSDIFGSKTQANTSIDSLRKALNNPTNVGIDIFSDVYAVFAKQEEKPENQFGILYFHLSDAKQFSSFIDKQVPRSYGFNSLEKEGEFYRGFLKGNKMIGWNANFAMLVFPLSAEAGSNVDSFFKRLVHLQSEDLIFNNENYTLFERESADLQIWLNNTDSQFEYLRSKLGQSAILLEFLKDTYQHSFVNFEEGQIVCDHKTYISETKQKDWEKLFQSKNTSSDVLSFFAEDQISGFVSLRYNPSLITRITEVFIQQSITSNPTVALLFAGTGITPDALTQMFRGNLLIMSAGLMEKKQEIVTYGYDDNFNRIAKKETQITKVPELLVSMNAKDDIQKILDKFRIAGIFQQEGNAYVIPFSGAKFYAEYYGDNLLISNSLNVIQDIKKTSSKHRLKELATNYPLSSYIDPKRVFKMTQSYIPSLLNQDIPIKEFKFYVDGLKDQVMESKMNFMMDDESENALIQLSKVLKRSKQMVQ